MYLWQCVCGCTKQNGTGIDLFVREQLNSGEVGSGNYGRRLGTPEFAGIR